MGCPWNFNKDRELFVYFPEKYIMRYKRRLLKATVLCVGAVLWIGSAFAAPLPLPVSVAAGVPFAAAAVDQSLADQTDPAELAPNLRRQVVDYSANVAPGTVIIDTAQTYLYFVLGDRKAIRYGIGVGREGFTWSGTERVTRKAEWPDWTPPAEMIVRQPYLARFTAGGEGNPLGARAIYLGNTMYRIHGTNVPETIGQNVSSGCIRLLNADVIDLYSRVNVGTKIIVLPNYNAIATIAEPVVLASPHSYDTRSSNIY
jgi:lipoprotein-anchoring transpeptidase ErfK/SrfK